MATDDQRSAGDRIARSGAGSLFDSTFESEPPSRKHNHNYGIAHPRFYIPTIINALTLLLVGWYACEAHKGNNLNEKQLAVLQRAYVSVNGLEILPVTKDADGAPNSWTVCPIISNDGNTPAKNLHWSFRVLSNLSAPPKPIDIMDVGTYFYPTTLGPHQNRRTLLPVAITPGMVDAIRLNRITHGVQGVLVYEDTLSTRLHITHYCYSLYAFPPVTGPGLSYLDCGGAAGSTLNCSDEECQDYDKLPELFRKLNR